MKYLIYLSIFIDVILMVMDDLVHILLWILYHFGHIHIRVSLFINLRLIIELFSLIKFRLSAKTYFFCLHRLISQLVQNIAHILPRALIINTQSILFTDLSLIGDISMLIPYFLSSFTNITNLLRFCAVVMGSSYLPS